MPQIRLFVSSTFADFALERALLHEQVFPRAVRYCERRGATFQAVDLRWGVTEQLAADQQTMQVCLAEIRRSRQLSPRPNCLVLLGDRYGWQPLPDTLDGPLFDSLAAIANDAERAQLQAAWVIDRNAQPPAYRLRRADERRPLAPDEALLRGLLERGAAELGAPAARVALTGAATHQEIMLAAFDRSARSGEVVAWMRAFDAVPDAAPTDWLPADYLPDGRRDQAAAARLARLKDEMGAALAPEVLARDSLALADYRAGGPLRAAYLGRFARHVLSRLLRQIRAQLAALRSADHADAEDDAHQRFGARRQEGLIGREADVALALRHLHGPARQPLVLTGAGGSGKTSVMAGVAAGLAQGVVVARYVGVTPASSSLATLVAALCERLDRAYRPEAGPAPLIEGESLASALDARLNLASAERPLYLLLDALDQFPEREQASLLRWLPPTLPPHAHIVLSCRDGFALPPRVERWALPALGTDVARELLQHWLDAHGRTLTADQHQAVLAGYAACPLPLWLRLASEQARRWHSDSGVPALPASLPGMVASAIGVLRRRHAPLLLEHALAYLGASRQGLSEVELGRLLAADPAVRAEFERNSHHPWDVASRGLPPVLWSRLRLDLGPYLVERAVDGALLLAFFHREFTDVVVRELVAPRAGMVHAALAACFAQPAGPDLMLQVEQGHVPALRRLTEQAWQLAQGGDMAGLAAVLGDFAFAMAKCGPGRLPDLLQDYAALGGLAGWRDFLRSQAGLLAQADARWPAYKILLQLAQELAPQHPVAQAADAWLAGGTCNWRWARRERRPTRLQEPALLAQFAGPAGESQPFGLVWELEGGRIATQSFDRHSDDCGSDGDAVVRIWQAASGLLEHELDQHVGVVRHLVALAGGRLATCDEGGWVRIWSAASGACLHAAQLAPDAMLQQAGQRLVLVIDAGAAVECRSADGLGLIERVALPESGCVAYEAGGDSVLLAKRVDPHWDADDKTAAYWCWRVGAPANGALAALGSWGQRLEGAAGRALLWSAAESSLWLFDGSGAWRIATLPAPAVQAVLLDALGVAVLLDDDRIALLAWDATPWVVLDPRGTPWSGRIEACRADDEDASVDWGVTALDDGAFLSWHSSRYRGYHVLRSDAQGAHQARWSGPGWLSALVPGPDARVLANYVWRIVEGDSDYHPLESWNARDGQVLATMRGHYQMVEHASWLPGGRVLSWSEDDSTVRTWNADSGRMLALFSLEGGVPRPLALADGSLLVSVRSALMRFNLDYVDEPAPPCGGLQMEEGLALAWDDGEHAMLWRGIDREVLSTVANSGDIARARLCGDKLLAWDASLERWLVWGEGEAGLESALAVGEAGRSVDDHVFRLCDGVLVSLAPQGTGVAFSSACGNVLLQHHVAGQDAPSLSVLLAAPWFKLATPCLLSAHCAALVGDKGVAIHVVRDGVAQERRFHAAQKLRAQLQLAGGLLCCFGARLLLWNGDGEQIASRALPAKLVALLPLAGGQVLACLQAGALVLDGADLSLCREHPACHPFRYHRASLAADDRIVLESRHGERRAVEILDAEGRPLQRLVDVDASPDAAQPVLQGDTLVLFGADGRWQHWDLATQRLCGHYRGMPQSSGPATLDGAGRLLWMQGSTPCLFDLADGSLLASAQPARAGLWLRAAPLSDVTQEGLALIAASPWPEGEQVFWTNGRNRSVTGLSDAARGCMLLKASNGFAKHQHSGFWIQLMDGAAPA